jgi:hypothetical protein
MFTVGLYRSASSGCLAGAARWKAHRERVRFTTRDRGRARRQANISARAVIRALVGTETMSSEQAVTNGFVQSSTSSPAPNRRRSRWWWQRRWPAASPPGAPERRRAFLERCGTPPTVTTSRIGNEHAYAAARARHQAP